MQAINSVTVTDKLIKTKLLTAITNVFSLICSFSKAANSFLIGMKINNVKRPYNGNSFKTTSSIKTTATDQ